MILYGFQTILLVVQDFATIHSIDQDSMLPIKVMDILRNSQALIMIFLWPIIDGDQGMYTNYQDAVLDLVKF